MKHELLQFFAFEHLPPHLRAVSEPFAIAAHAGDLRTLEPVLAKLPCNLESNEALAKVCKAAECFKFAKRRQVLGFDSTVAETQAIRKLLEAKDCAVRAVLYRAPGTTSPPADPRQVTIDDVLAKGGA